MLDFFSFQHWFVVDILIKVTKLNKSNAKLGGQFLGYEESPGWKIKYTLEGHNATVHMIAIKMTIEGKIE